MEIRAALKEQYHAGLAMLRQCVERCPDELWASGKHPRTYWRIAFHAIFYTHLYLGQGEDAFQPWPGRREEFPEMWGKPWNFEPFELPEETPLYQASEILQYIAFVDALV